MKRIWADIEPFVQAESDRQNHYYLGVEHLFIALLNLDNSRTQTYLRQIGVDPVLAIYMVRDLLGQAIDRRYWNGYRPTPRYLNVLLKAQQFSAMPTEDELLRAILEEGDNIPVRVLADLGVDIPHFINIVKIGKVDFVERLPELQSQLPLTRSEQLLIQRLYPEQPQVKVLSEFSAGTTSARFYQVSFEGLTHVSLVKMDTVDAILREYRKFVTFVRDLLPQASLDLVELPVTTEELNLAAMRYEFRDVITLLDFQTFALENGERLTSKVLLDGVYAGHPGGWWAHTNLYEFELWREYEHLFPPALVIQSGQPTTPEDIRVIEPLGAWSRTPDFVHGQFVELRDFTVLKISPVRGVLLVGAGFGDDAVNLSSQVEITGWSKAALADFYVGQNVRSLVGRVVQTRTDLLNELLYQLMPTFDTRQHDIPTPIGMLPNPIYFLGNVLNAPMKGYFSTIHGALNLSNIAVGEEGRAYLLNFDATRESHILYDWAYLEVSILCDLVSHFVEDNWEATWAVGKYFHVLSSAAFLDQNYDSDLEKFLVVVAVVRQVVSGLLADPDDWREYLAVLSLISFSASFSGSLRSRRLLFVWSMLSNSMVNFLGG